MDPLCHTLVGASLGFTGLEKRARFGRITLIAGANMPDVDAITYFMSPVTSLGFRRGWTHGVLALIVLPLILAGLVKLLDRLWPRTGRSPPCEYRQVLLLSAIAISTHPILDFMNNYGMRWLMPFVDKWWYGDTLFIIEPSVWAVLFLGLVLTWLTNSAKMKVLLRPASLGLVLVTAYILMSAVVTSIASRTAHTALQENRPERLMASPMPLDPFKRYIVAESGDEYLLGIVDVLDGPSFVHIRPPIPKGEDHPAVGLAKQDRNARIFLHWARFPYFDIEELPHETIVHIIDARYETRRRAGFGSYYVTLPKSSP